MLTCVERNLERSGPAGGAERTRPGNRRDTALVLSMLLLASACAMGGRPRLGQDSGPVTIRDGGTRPDVPPIACASDAECDDGDVCNGVERCSGGTCAPGAAVDCDDALDCTADTCDPASGACSHAAQDARCPSGMVCDPVDGCETPLACATDAECDDGVFCNGPETCDPAVGCRSGGAPSCDDAIACTIDMCDASSDACTSTPDHARCGDALACNGVETCDAARGGCAMGTPVACDDGIACTLDACVEPGGTCTSTGADGDGDGYVAAGCLGGNDCNDGSAAVNPGAAEICDGVDNDCSGAIDDGGGMQCALGSGASSCTTSCGTSGTRACSASCTFGACTAATETCGNGCDDDGDGSIDEGCGPPNDACGGAIALSGTGMRSDTLVGASAQTTDCGSGVEVFYSVSVSAPTVVYLSTLGGATFDTRISYRGTSCPGASGQCVDDSCGTVQTQLAQLVPAGTHYFAVHTYSSFTTPGAFTLRHGLHAAAGQDNVLVPLGGAGTISTRTGSTVSGTSRVDGTCAGGSGPEDSYYWLQCTADARGYAANTCTGTSYDSQLSMYFNGTQIGCNDDSCGLQSSFTGASASGAGLVQLFVDGYSTGSYGSYSVAITF